MLEGQAGSLMLAYAVTVAATAIAAIVLVHEIVGHLGL